MQNCPRTKDIKNIFTASKGYKLIQLDYSQCIAQGSRVGGIPIERHKNAVNKSNAQIVEVRTKRGYTVRCTKDHKILTSKGFKEVSKLEAGDFIALQPQDCTKRKSDALSRFIGFWVGDGAFCGSKSGISVSRKEPKYEQDVRNIIENAGLQVGYEADYSFGVKCGNTKLTKFLRETFDKKQLRVPEYLELKKARSSLAEFLGGVFDADGTVVENTISMSTAQLIFAQDIQRCLLYFGVMSTVIKKHGGYNFIDDGKDYWEVKISDSYSIASFNKLIGFCMQPKRVKAESIKPHRDYSNFLPTLTCEEVRASGADYRKFVFNHLHGRTYTRFKASKLNVNQQHFRYQWDSFVEYSEAGEAIVYDLIDEPEHRFAANGVIVHNCELRVLGVLSDDDFLIKSYIEDKDLHANVAQEIFGENFTKEQRTMAKTVNFGIAYGRGPGAIAEAFKLSKAEAQGIVSRWFGAMPKVEKYIKGQRKAADNGERQQTMFGRVRHYVKTDDNGFHIQNEYINTPIQSMASDLTVTSLCVMHDWLVANKLYDPKNPHKSKAKIIITVHDSIVLEVEDNPELVEMVARKCQSIMRDVPSMMIPNCKVPFKADIETGYAWGALEELE